VSLILRWIAVRFGACEFWRNALSQTTSGDVAGADFPFVFWNARSERGDDNYDWRYRVISNLLSPRDNFHHCWLSACGISLAAL
jgi:hypothetical protein